MLNNSAHRGEIFQILFVCCWLSVVGRLVVGGLKPTATIASCFARVFVYPGGSARTSRAVFGALAEHTVQSAGRRPVQPRRLRSHPMATTMSAIAGPQPKSRGRGSKGPSGREID